MNDIGSRLRLALKARETTQTRLAEQIGLTPAMISAIALGKAMPSDRTVTAICDALSVNESWLRDGIGPMERQAPKTAAEELARQYGLSEPAARLLNAIAQVFADLPADVTARIAERLRKAMSAPADSAPEPPAASMAGASAEDAAPGEASGASAAIVTLRTYKMQTRLPVTTLRRYEMPSAAGVPIFDDSGDYEEVTYPADIVPHGTSFSVIIAGHSMEPTIPNGATVFVQEGAEIQDKEIVIVWIDGEGLVCKRARVLGDALVRLDSDNAAFPGIEGAGLKHARILGRVLGHTETADRPEPFAPPPPGPASPEASGDASSPADANPPADTTVPGERIRQARLALGFTAGDVARAMTAEADERVTVAQVRAWEAGRYRVPERLLKALCKVLFIAPN